VSLYSLDKTGETLVVKVPTVGGEMSIDTGLDCDSYITFTATTDMQQAVGKVADGGIRTVWDGSLKEITNARYIGEISVGDRVWLTEHLTLSGKMELVASKRQPACGDINFINVISSKTRKKRVKIDIITGEVG